MKKEVILKNKLLKKIRDELDYSNSFFDGEINIVIDIISKNIDKYVKDNKTYKTRLDLLIEKVKKLINLKRSDSR